MKKLFTLLSLMALICLSANVWAQSTGTNPAPGATHSYSVDVNAGSTYEWSVTKNSTTVSAGSDAVLSATTGNAITITWANTLTPSATDYYYVHVIETNGSGCKNEKVLPVKIAASQFYVTIAAATTTDCWDSDVTVVETGTAAAPTVAYNHGNVTVEYTVTPHGTSDAHSGYTFDIALPLPTDYSLASATTVSNGSLSGSTVTVSNNNPTTITYTITRTNLTDSTDSLGDQADFTATATISSGMYNGISDNGTNPKSDSTSISRPNTPSIQTN